MAKPSTIKIDDVEYVRSDELESRRETLDDWVIVRGDRSGVFMGSLQSREGREVRLFQCRRLWYWSGAASISQLSIDGVKNPSECKFPEAIPDITILDAIEIVPVTQEAKSSIDGVSIWQE